MTLRDLADRLKTSIAGAAAGLRDELRTNPRARLGLLGLVLVVLLAGALRVAQHTANRQAEIATLRVQERELTVMASPEQAARWAEADGEIARRLQEAEDRLWSDAPVGVAHADFLAWIEAATEAAGVSGAQIQLGDVRRIGDGGQITELRVRLFATSAAGAVSQDAVYTLLRTIAENPRVVYARSLRVRFIDPILIEAEFAAFCRSAPSSGDAQPGSGDAGARTRQPGQGSST